MSDNKCENCKYCVESINVNNVAQKQRNCYYSPPSPFPLPGAQGTISIIAIRPGVNADDWCSFWEPIEH